jgi:hypothetical protein
MSLSTLAFSVAISLLSFDTPPEPAPVAPPASEPAPAPAPATTPAPTPAPAPAQTYPVQPGYQDPYAQPAPTPAPAYEPDEPTGIGMMVTGPLLVAVGVPFSLLGNASWRENCGPLDSDSACFGGTAGAIASHAVAGVAFGTGILLTGLGAQRKGTYDGKRDPSRSATGFVTGGAVLLPLSLAGMLAVRTVLLTEAIDCEVQSCVAQFQNNRGRQRAAMLMPAVGRNFAGLSLTGRF